MATTPRILHYFLFKLCIPQDRTRSGKFPMKFHWSPRAPVLLFNRAV